MHSALNFVLLKERHIHPHKPIQFTVTAILKVSESFLPLRSLAIHKKGRNGMLLRAAGNTGSKALFLAAVCICGMVAKQAQAATRAVQVSPSTNQFMFVDAVSGNSSTTINLGDTVTWEWNGTFMHSTTSGTGCSNGGCAPDGRWDSGVTTSPHNFSVTFNTPGTFPYFCIVHGMSMGMVGTVTVIAPPDYALSISNPRLTVFPNQAGQQFNGTLTAINGYNSPVTISCGSGAPSTCGGAATTPTGAFAIQASDPLTKDFNFNLNAVGSDAKHIMHSQAVTLRVVDFSLGALSSNSVNQPTTGSSAPVSFTVNAVNGFSGTVTLGCGGLPANVTCSFNPSANVILAGNSVPTTVTFTANGATAADSQITITANSQGGAQKSQNLTLHVEGFSLTAPSPASITTFPTNASTAISFQVTAGGSFSSAVALSCKGLPQVASCNFAPSASVNPTSSTPVNAMVTVTTAGTPAGNSVVTIAGDSAGFPEQTQSFNLAVQDFGVSAQQPLQTVFPTQSANFSGSVMSLNGYANNVSLSCLTAPSPCSFTPNTPITPTANGTPFSDSLTTTGATVPADYPFGIQATGSDVGVTTHTQNATLRVVDFNIGNFSSNSITVAQGNPSAAVTFNVSGLGQFSGGVTLICSGAAISGGASCNFAPSATVFPGPGGSISVTMSLLSSTAPVANTTLTVSANAAGAPAAKTQDLALNITTGSATAADLSVTFNPAPHALNDAVLVGSTILYNLALQNSVNSSNVPANVLLTFSAPVMFGALPNTCLTPVITGDSLTCQVAGVQGTLPPLPIPVIAPLVRSLSATVTVSSASADATPADNIFSDTAQIRLRPFARKGLPFKLP
jgi:plastocyanin